MKRQPELIIQYMYTNRRAR